MSREKKVKKTRRIHADSGLNKDMQGKLVVLFFMVLLAFAGLSVKLISITRDNGEQYKKKVLSQQRYESTSIPFKRGDILDAKGNKLAASEKVYNLIVDSKIMHDKEENVDATLGAIHTCFPLIDISKVREYVTTHEDSQYYVVEKQLTYEQISPFVQMQNNKEEYPNIAGVWFEEEYKRVYPNNELACDVIGFTGKDNVGQYGLEQYYNSTLNGANGRKYGYLNEEEDLERTTIPATDGYSIVTTIDANVQQIVEKYLYQFHEDNKNAARTGNGANNLGCIIMDVNSGDIIAMASYPNFDLNNPFDTDRLLGSKKVDEKGNVAYDAVVLTEENIGTELEDEQLKNMNLNALWKNFCISETYEPGSTFKPFTVAMGLESGKLTGDEYYTCNGALQVSNYNIRCHNHKKGGCGTLSVKGCIENSCNVSLMLMGKQIGSDVFLDYQNKFNFGLKTNIDLYGEARTNTLVFNKDTMGETELATATFGQGQNVTMVQMITGYCSLINGGYYYEPHMVSKVIASDGSVVKNVSPRVLKQTISAQTSEKIVDYCIGVVEEGTGKNARPAGYRIGGKTGTAETIPRDRTNYVLSFMGFAPADNPQIAIYVVVDRPNSWAQDSVSYAMGITRNILTEVLPYMNIYMTEELSPKEEEELAALNIAIKRADVPEDENEEEDGEDKPDVDENGNIDAHGGDITSSIPLTDEEFESDDGTTAPLTGTVLNMENGEGIKKDNGEVYYE